MNIRSGVLGEGRRIFREMVCKCRNLDAIEIVVKIGGTHMQHATTSQAPGSGRGVGGLGSIDGRL